MTSYEIERHLIQSRLAAAIAQRAKGPVWEPLELDGASKEISALEAMLLHMDAHGDDTSH